MSGVVQSGERGKIFSPLRGCVLSICRIFTLVACKDLLSCVVNVRLTGKYATSHEVKITAIKKCVLRIILTKSADEFSPSHIHQNISESNE